MSEAITEEMDLQKDWYEEAKGMTLEKLPEFLRKLTEDYQHDYGTIVHAITAAAVAAAQAVQRSPAGGITGFQASCVTIGFIKHWGRMENPGRIVDYGDLLFPQYAHKFRTIPEDVWKWLQEKAREHIANRGGATPTVIDHWESISHGKVPFGLTIER